MSIQIGFPKDIQRLNNKTLAEFIFSKKSIFVLAVAMLFSAQLFAQNFDDTRRKTESFARLSPADVRADVATFTLSGIGESVGKLPLAKISYSSLGADSMEFSGDGIKAKVTIVPFDPAAHKLMYDEKTLTKIDKRTYYGNYGSVPQTSISSVVMIIGGDTVEVPPIAYQDLHNLNFTYNDKGTQRTRNGVFKSKDGHKVYLYLFSKDNTGSYEVTWIFVDKKYFRRVLDYGFM